MTQMLEAKIILVDGNSNIEAAAEGYSEEIVSAGGRDYKVILPNAIYGNESSRSQEYSRLIDFIEGFNQEIVIPEMTFKFYQR